MKAALGQDISVRSGKAGFAWSLCEATCLKKQVYFGETICSVAAAVLTLCLLL